MSTEKKAKNQETNEKQMKKGNTQRAKRDRKQSKAPYIFTLTHKKNEQIVK